MTIDPIWTPETQQRVFRRLLSAMARPATLWDLSDIHGSDPSWKAVLATLVDGSVNLSDPHGLLDERSWQFLQAVASSPDKAGYILADGALNATYDPFPGRLESPESGATIILCVSRLGQSGACLACSGPGIEDTQDLLVSGLASQWLDKRLQWNENFPLGVDFILADDRQIAALPRTTRVKRKEA